MKQWADKTTAAQRGQWPQPKICVHRSRFADFQVETVKRELRTANPKQYAKVILVTNRVKKTQIYEIALQRRPGKWLDGGAEALHGFHQEGPGRVLCRRLGDEPDDRLCG
jgi:hypothetical protein